MKIKDVFVYLFTLCFVQLIFCQDNKVLAWNIPQDLKENTNIVFRKNHKEINISSQQKMTTSEIIYVTFLNESGWKSFELGEYYDKSDKIRSIEAFVYDSFGKEIKKIKRSDFTDNSIADGFSIYTDNRMLTLNYTPVSYPFTIKYSSIVETSNTAFIAQWFPVFSTGVSIEESSVTVTYPADLGFRYKEYNFENYPIEKTENTNSITFRLTNFPAIKHEDYTPSLIRFAPYVRFALHKFHLEGVYGEASTWEELGKWINTSFLIPTNDLPETTKEKIRKLVENEPTNRKKAEKIYQYVQNKTRYVSIQLGIGGWKPMNAKDVDRLGYGDCKALTNYTKALLEAVEIPSYYSVIHNSSAKRDMNEDFVSMQGNHVILSVPSDDNDLYWLECTSQIIPFNFIGSNNDDRLALSINNDKAELKRTHVYTAENNSQTSTALYSIDQKGSIKGNLSITTRGIQYGNRMYLERQSFDDINKYYKSYFLNINNLKIQNFKFNNDTDSLAFQENISLEGDNYTDISGERLIFVINAFNQYKTIPQRYRKRTTPFEISRGFSDYDEFTIALPDGYAIEAIPDDFELTTKFGHYKTELTENENTILYKRTFISYEGFYPKEEYDDFRNFREQISRNDNAKIVLIKKQI